MTFGLSVARSSRGDTLGKILYCTTYPCHNCARHIIAVGIKRVVYIEPYAKSLAEDLHGDSITGSDAQDKSNKVIFDIFEGTAPRRYSKFFGYSRDRKDADGKWWLMTLIAHIMWIPSKWTAIRISSLKSFKMWLLKWVKKSHLRESEEPRGRLQFM